MEKKTTVGPKGQVVIPKDIRDKIGIKEYSEVIVDIMDDSVISRNILKLLLILWMIRS
jgi:AbrB family looped-hinge helix DNA binding protein